MTVAVFPVVLAAALLHATWNAIVKGGPNKLFSMVIVTGSAALCAILLLPFLQQPAAPSWKFIAVSSVLEISYFALVAETYRIADMGETYPIMRGTAPLLVAAMSVAVLHEPLTPVARLGIVAICTGILGMAIGRGAGRARSVTLALVNAVLIAGCTLIDGAGVRRSGASVSYTLWVFLLTGLPLAAWAFATRARDFRRYIVGNWTVGLVGGVGTVTSYGLTLWAMTVASIPVVAALRETSILFGTAISGLVLKERTGPARIVGACIVAGGVIILRLA